MRRFFHLRALRHRWPLAADALVLIGLLVATVWLWLAPAPKPYLEQEAGVRTETAEVLSVDDSGLMTLGRVEYGTERLTVRLADGRELTAYNEVRGQLELDKRFRPGDTALLSVREFPSDEAGGPAETAAIARDHWRLGRAGGLFAAFALLLIVFGGFTGLKALFTFVFSCLAIWKLMVRYAIEGHSASLISFATVAVLTAAIVFLVAGISRKGLSAFLGSMLGVLASFALAHVSVGFLHVNGATMAYAQQLLNLNLPNLDLQDIFIGAIVLASSGAVMDLAMDIASGIQEVAYHNPALGFRALFASGVRMGRAVVGTMTTTLLLAYSGGYLTLLMVFASEGTKPADFINSTLVSAEIVKTLVGSFGLVLVAPFTALVSAFIYSRRR